MTSISFIVPAFNEERDLGATLKAIVEAGDTLAGPYEIVVADDGSDRSDRSYRREAWRPSNYGQASPDRCYPKLWCRNCQGRYLHFC